MEQVLEHKSIVEETLAKARHDRIKFVLLQFTDINGIVKNVTIPATELKESLERGTWFDGSSIEGFARIYESDMYLKPDPSTYSVIPWFEAQDTARLICDVYKPDGTVYESDPRHVLRKAIKEAEAMGYRYMIGPEPEFFLLKKEDGKPFTHDKGGYFDLNLDKAFSIRAEMVEALEKMGIKVEASHHEVAHGQHEIDFRYADALRTADNVITFKFTLKAIAQKYGLIATFMPKPIFGINGSGMHCHQSLTSIKTGKNAFYDADDPYLLSHTARKFIAGQLRHVREMSAVLAPLVNSYKRLVPGYEAPAYICWSKTNRSALIRIPRYNPEKSEAARAELRCPDPSCNPYLAFAAMLKAGLQGLTEDLKTPEPVEEDVFEFDEEKLHQKYIETLPGSLGEAIAELNQSRLIHELFGDDLFRKFVRSRKAEWDDYRIRVSEWELERYLEKY